VTGTLVERRIPIFAFSQGESNQIPVTIVICAHASYRREISRPSARTLLGDERVALVQEISAYSESAKVVPVPVEGLVDEEEEMMRSMGFGSFESTKGKPVEDNLETAARGAVLKNKKRVYRYSILTAMSC
jgi:hypothetical protein